MRTIYLRVLLFAGILMVSYPVFAHHGDASYDAKSVSVKGTVTAFLFVNPHIQITINAKDDKGNPQTWQGELNSPNLVARSAGWTKTTLKPGDEIILVGYQAKNGTPFLRLQKVLQADGTPLYPKSGNAGE